ncbi:hypothetical protein DFH09DRAFT_1050306 [Mycena vulgaris]|nr:hypothetical protein DFH09DRAFT_1050306 [Mycena vulgaris]
MLSREGFSAWITIDGKEATEYDVETSDDQKTVTCWIPSELGKIFSVNWKISAYPQDTIGLVEVDGNMCGGPIVYTHSLPKTSHEDGISDGMNLKPFMFSSLELTGEIYTLFNSLIIYRLSLDDDAFLGEASHKGLGVIELTILPIEVTERNVAPRVISLPDIKVHERTKKAVTQHITLAKAVAKPEVFVRWKRAGPDVVKFSFKYRPLDILQANGIAPLPSRLKRKASVDPPRTPTPDEDVADAEEQKILREKLAALEAKRLKKEKKSRVKHEFEAGATIDLTQPRKKVKLEVKRPLISGEVIDLT